MGSTALPTALLYLAGRPGEAADTALAEALHEMPPAAQPYALEMLSAQPRSRALRAVVGRFAQFDPRLQELIVSRCDACSSAIRHALMSPELHERLSAVELAVRGRSFKDAYLLADALRSRCVRTRERAAAGLYDLAAAWVALRDNGAARDGASRQREAASMEEALGAAVTGWELHLRPEALEAALWLGHRMESSVRRKLAEPRTKIARVLRGLLERASDPRLGEFVLLALAIPELRAAAARGISRAEDRAFVRSLLDATWLLTDREVERGCRRVRCLPWLALASDGALGLDARTASGAVRLLAASGVSGETRLACYAEWLVSKNDALRHAVFRVLVNDPSEAAAEMLGHLAARRDGELSTLADRELRHRRVTEAANSGAEIAHGASPEHTRASPPDDGSTAATDPGPEGALGDARANDRALRARLGSGAPDDRRRALEALRERDDLENWDEEVYARAHDPDPGVRRVAVVLLGQLPGATSRRILRSKVQDHDERVQANAIEALERLDVDERLGWTEPMLDSPNSRVRANAVKSLLPLNMVGAGETLLAMLEDPNAAQRLSALWVVEQLGLRALRNRLVGLAGSDCDARVRQTALTLLQRLECEEPSEGLSGSTAAPPDATVLPGASR